MCDASCSAGAVMYQRQTSNRDGTGIAYMDSMGRTIRSVQSLAGEQKVGKDKVYNELGLLVRESKPYFLSDGPSQWMSYGYDELNRQNLITMPDGAQSNVIHDGLTTISIDPLGRSTISIQDSRGLLQTMTNPKGEVLSYAYDASGQLHELKDAGGNITRMEYDIYGRRTLLDEPSTGISSTEYNVLNNPLRYTDPTGHFFEGIGREINRALKTGGNALRNPGAFLQNTWDKAGRGLSDPRYLRLAASIAISVVATVNCPIGADAAWYQTAAYYAAVGATSSYVASNGDQKAALNGAYTGAAFNMVGSYFQFASSEN